MHITRPWGRSVLAVARNAVGVASCIAVAAGLVGCGGSILDRARAGAPTAITQHLADGRAFEASRLVDVPASAAWNATVETVRRDAPVAEANFAARRLSTHWVYDPPSEQGGVARQRRTRYHVQLSGADAQSFNAGTRAESELRQRETCGDPTSWSSTGSADTSNIDTRTAAAIAALSDVQLSELQFPGTPDEVLPVVRDLLLARWGLAPAPNGLSFPLRAGWRETQTPAGNLTLQVRSSVRVNARPSLARAQSQPSVHLDVDAVLEWHGALGEEGTAWIPGDSAPVARDFFGLLAERLPPLRIAVQAPAPIEPRDPEPSAPDLPAPVDPVVGQYALYVTAIQLPLRAPDGLDWDVGGMLAPVIRYAPAAIRVLRVMMGDVSSVLELLTQAVGAWVNGGIEDHIARAIADRIGQTVAPDIQLVLTLPSGEQVSLDGADNSHVAGWTEPIQILEMNGNAALRFEVWERDPVEPDLAARGSFSAADLANACRPVCQPIAGGGQICAELRRVRSLIR